MFSPYYQLPRIRINKQYHQNIILYSNCNSSDVYDYNESNTNQFPLIQLVTNPCFIFIFLSLYSIWFGGFTKRQIYNFLNNQTKH